MIDLKEEKWAKVSHILATYEAKHALTEMLAQELWRADQKAALRVHKLAAKLAKYSTDVAIIRMFLKPGAISKRASEVDDKLVRKGLRTAVAHLDPKHRDPEWLKPGSENIYAS